MSTRHGARHEVRVVASPLRCVVCDFRHGADDGALVHGGELQMSDQSHFCTIRELLALLELPASTFYSERKKGTFPIREVLPRIGHARFLRAEIEKYRRGDFDLPRFFAKARRRVA